MQQAGEQAAVAADQGAVVRQFQLDPAEQLGARCIDGLAGEAQVLFAHRQQEACGVLAGQAFALQHIAARRRIEHAWAGMGQAFALGGEKADRANVGLIERLGGDALQQFGVAAPQRGCGQGRQLFGDHLSALQQLRLHAG